MGKKYCVVNFGGTIAKMKCTNETTKFQLTCFCVCEQTGVKGHHTRGDVHAARLVPRREGDYLFLNAHLAKAAFHVLCVHSLFFSPSGFVPLTRLWITL